MSADKLREAAKVLRERANIPPAGTVDITAALDLAEILDREADEMERHIPAWEVGAVRWPETWAGRTVEGNIQHHYGRYLALADLILGGAS